jgi:hypothetical protein
VGPDVPSRDGVKFCSVLRPDHNPSCSIIDGRYHDWSQERHLDSFNLYQELSRQDAKSAFVPFVTLAGLANELNGDSRAYHNGKHALDELDWPSLVHKVTADRVKELSEWRGYSIEFCQWLRDSQNIG